MDPQTAIDLARTALLTALVIAAPVLVAGTAVGLVVGIVQAVTQVQEQSVGFVAKLVVMVFVLSLSLPWLVTRMIEYFRDLVENIPSSL